MTRIDRIDRALTGRPVDRVPWSAWYHFGLQHAPGKRLAAAALEFYRAYRPDFLKLMHDYPYPLPAGLEELSDPKDLARLRPLEMRTGGYGEQLAAVREVVRRLKREAYCLDTVFDPWTLLRKLTGRARLREWMRTQPAAVHRALELIARNQAAYVRAARKAGLDGVFYSAGAADREQLTPAVYAEFCRPYDLLVLDAARGAAFNLLHIHGERPIFDPLLDYPVHAINWAGQRVPPSLREGRARWRGCIVGGIEETTATSVTPAEIRRQVAAAILALGEKGTMIGPGCAVGSNIPPRNLLAIPAALDALAGRKGRKGGTA